MRAPRARLRAGSRSRQGAPVFRLRLGGARRGDRIGGRRLLGLLAPRGIDLIAQDIGEAGKRADDEHDGDAERDDAPIDERAPAAAADAPA